MILDLWYRLNREAMPIWEAGGWAMIALALNALVIFMMGWKLCLQLIRHGAFARPDRAWEKVLRQPGSARGPFSRILKGAMSCRDLDDLQRYFETLHSAEFRLFSRDLKVMKVAVSTAPLLGLLGTVTGMLTTFKALAEGAGGQKTMGMFAKGISEALITTETGLVLALSGLIFQYSLSRLHEQFNKKVAHLETQCAQKFHQGDSSDLWTSAGEKVA
ncbi:MAG: MotA/TolQ/ExbB proton channel family protein [Kiritimatiellia bacterium]|nr:MotA/TolQ/ExbB proton channel family protein [Kiritimatiellia bacterium]